MLKLRLDLSREVASRVLLILGTKPSAISPVCIKTRIAAVTRRLPPVLRRPRVRRQDRGLPTAARPSPAIPADRTDTRRSGPVCPRRERQTAMLSKDIAAAQGRRAATARPALLSGRTKRPVRCKRQIRTRTPALTRAQAPLMPPTMGLMEDRMLRRVVLPAFAGPLVARAGV